MTAWVVDEVQGVRFALADGFAAAARSAGREDRTEAGHAGEEVVQTFHVAQEGNPLSRS